MPHHAAALFVGLAAWDTIALVPHFPEADSRVIAESVVEAGGGPAATAAVACARLGVPSAFIGAIGDDLRGTRIRDALAGEGVDVSGLVLCPGAASTAAVIVADRSHGTRALCPTLPPPLTLGPAHAARIAAASIVHVDQAGYGPVMALSAARTVSVDAGNPIPGLDPARVALFAPTMLQLQRMHDVRDAATLLRRVEGPRWVVATDGGNGAFVRADGRLWHVPAYPAAPCISTLGAGDVFHGALVAAWLHGLQAPEAAAYAAIAAGLSCRAIDGRSAIPDHKTVLAALATHRPRPLAKQES